MGLRVGYGPGGASAPSNAWTKAHRRVCPGVGTWCWEHPAWGREDSGRETGWGLEECRSPSRLRLQVRSRTGLEAAEHPPSAHVGFSPAQQGEPLSMLPWCRECVVAGQALGARPGGEALSSDPALRLISRARTLPASPGRGHR